MTVIVCDGRYVAADKMGVGGGYANVVNKLERFGSKVLATCGPADTGWAMRFWYKAGCPANEFPNRGLSLDDMAWLTVFQLGRPVVEYQKHAVPIIHSGETVFCGGSGREAARAALIMGADAERAVEVASRVMAGHCGFGVDVLELLPSEPAQSVGDPV